MRSQSSRRAAAVGTSIAPVVLAFTLTVAISTGLLFGVTPGDVVTYVVSAAGLLAVALLAAAVPARRAARIDGSRVLRS